MDEKRNFFRIKNPNPVKIKYGKQDLYIIDISPGGARVITEDTHLIREGIIEVLINHFSIKINYKLLKDEGGSAVINFFLEDQVNSLLAALKNVRNSIEMHEEDIPNLPMATHAITNHITCNMKENPKIDYLLKLSTLYSIRLYQMIKQYSQEGQLEISLDDLRQALGIDKLKTYFSYAAMKNKIIEPSKNEINEKTDLTITYSDIKEEKKVVAVKFLIISIT